MLSFVLQFVNVVLVHALYFLGVTSFSVYITLASAVINIGGNLFTVLVLGMGVAGLALSTLVSVAVVTVVYVYMGQSLSWLADGAMSVLVYFLLYHSDKGLGRAIEKARRRV